MNFDPPLPIAEAVRRATIRLGRRLQAERPEASLSLAQVSVLGHLHRRGPMTPGELAAADRLQPQSLTRVLAGLERAGLVARQPDERDRRRSRIALTDLGLAALVQDMRPRDEWLAAAIAGELSPVERDLLRLAAPLLERLADAGTGAASADFARPPR